MSSETINVATKNELNGSTHCKANDILNSHADDFTGNCKYTSKRYNTVFEYCTDLAKKLGQRQAFYVLDLADILWKVQLWKSRLPNVEIFYAVKANDDANLLKLLALLGLSFDCASENEIRMTMAAGAVPANIIFAHTIKPDEELRNASKVGVDLLTFDNEEELHKIHRVFPNSKLILRLCPTEVKCVFDLSKKFGCLMEEVVPLLKLAQQLHLNVVGVSFHVGALCLDPRSYTSTIRNCRWVFDRANEMGFNFSILDIGGGFFGSTCQEKIFYEVTDAINQALNEYFPDKNTRVIGEPGCYIVNSAGRLVCTVLGKKSIKQEEGKETIRCYYINEGIYGSFFRDFHLYGITVEPLLSSLEIESRPVFPTTFFGQTCCSEDYIRFNGPLTDMEVGELVVWNEIGSYGRGIASTFCGMLLPIQMPIFTANQRLNMDWIDNKKEIKEFLKKTVTFIGCGEENI